ncbi:uncharacterized protein J7T54_007755 [Emericellopsis cladophorae]|uniref:Uncharacterized protein n=1 Tax=Emericellopsis cladophorae TaxID=2686198 RepID=A0A9P9XX25_9HYPO|nr:uncharacterized protein J7T54_007755 [Emericellopsis cladophorae]KAI6779228.1 hypothetical protein J7T54_007755 [Emericellopsis cladophorae]
MPIRNSSKSFAQDKDIPSLAGKVILITGGNIGLGKQAVLDFAQHGPHQIWIASRNVDKARAAAAEIAQQVPGASSCIKLLELDLSSFVSIRRAAKKFMAESPRLDILMLNAGIMAVPPGLTEDGYEMQFGTNHMGHALLAKLLLPKLEATAAASPDEDVRIVSMSSFGHTRVPKGGFRFDMLKTTAEDLGAYGRYYQSKLANVLWIRHLAKVYPNLTVAAIHPGLVRTQLMEGATATPWIVRTLTKVGGALLTPVIQGVKNQLWASVSKDVVSGEYYEPVGVAGKASEDGRDDSLAEKLWNWTEEELKAFE